MHSDVQGGVNTCDEGTWREVMNRAVGVWGSGGRVVSKRLDSVTPVTNTKLVRFPYLGRSPRSSL